MSSFRVHARNLTAVWGADGARLAVAFFLSPFVVHTLGDVRYGIWSLVLSIVGYMGLADVGLRKSISKHLNQHLAEGDKGKALEVISTALMILLATGILIVPVAWLVGRWIHLVFDDLSGAYREEVRSVLLISALTLAAILIGSLFKRAVEARNRFDLLSGVQLAGLLLRTAGIVTVLLVSPDLVGLALVILLTEVVIMVGCIGLAYRVWPGFHVSLSYCNLRTAKALWRFGVPAFVDSISSRIIRFTDLLVIGFFLGVEAVAIYSIGNIVIRSAQDGLVKIVSILTPEMFKRSGVGDRGASRHMLVRASNVTALASLPVLIGCFFFAEPFVKLWMGPEYVLSARVMQVLALSTLAMTFSQSSRVIVLGFGKASLAATMSVIEAALNLGLSVLFITVFDWGVVGVAVGTLIPAVIVEGVWRPWVALRLTGMTGREFFGRVVLRWALAGGMFTLLCLASRPVPVGSWALFGITTLLLALVYVPIGWYGLLDRQTRASVRLA